LPERRGFPFLPRDNPDQGDGEREKDAEVKKPEPKKWHFEVADILGPAKSHWRIDPACSLSVVSQTKIMAGRTAAATSLRSGDLEAGRVENRTRSTRLKTKKVWT